MITWELREEEPRCGAKRGSQGRVACELPTPHPAQWSRYHTGRDKLGRWHTWEVTP